jgi:hypothetical protein
MVDTYGCWRVAETQKRFHTYGGIHEKWRESGGKMDERDEDGGRTMTMCDVAKIMMMMLANKL